MITLENRFFPVRIAACFLVEGALIFFSVFLSYYLIDHLHHVNNGFAWGDVALRGVLVGFFCQSCMYFLDLYDLRHSNSLIDLFFSLILAMGVVCIGVGLVVYAFPRFSESFELYSVAVLISGVLLLIWRVVFNIFLAHIAYRAKILVVGTGSVAYALAREIRDRERLGFVLVGLVGPPPPQGAEGVDESIPVIGVYGDVIRIAREKRVWKVVVAINDRRGSYPVDEMLSLRVNGFKVVEWPSFFEKLSGRVLLENLSPSYFIFSEGFQKNPVVLFARRATSFLISSVMLLLLSPVMLVVAAVVKADSPGPVLYSQDRVGKDGRTFRIYKFRSMTQNAEAAGTAVWAVKDDPRVTRIGRYLRLTRLDELPQLFNVLKGDLDLVGPRPERPSFVEELRKVIPYYGLRHTVKPGLTGWAQVEFTYCGTIEESREKLQYDLFYIKNMSIKLDLLILFKTVKIVLLGRGAR